MASVNNLLNPATTAATNNAAAVASAESDITTLLTQMKAMEGDREKLLQQVQLLQEKIGKLTEGKKQEMQKALDTVINNWLMESVNDEQVREEFKKGMSRLVDQTAEESGVWQVVCCASNLHAQRLQELETLRTEVNELKKSGQGQFRDPNSRKRDFETSQGVSGVIEPVAAAGISAAPGNVWEEFALNFRATDFVPHF
jgi:chromosome segregation ATPase